MRRTLPVHRMSLCLVDVTPERDMGNKMADSDEWFVGEDGCLSVGKPTDGVTYHSTLNTILVATKEPALRVLDVTSGLVLQGSDLSGESSSLRQSVSLTLLCTLDHVMSFASCKNVSARKETSCILICIR